MEVFFEREVYLSAVRLLTNFLAISLGLSICHFAIYAIFARGRSKLDLTLIAFHLVAMALLGVMTGYAGGNSRESVVGEVVPALLSFLGAGSLFYLGLKKVHDAAPSVLVSCLIISVFVGFSVGAKKRSLYEANHSGPSANQVLCEQVFANPRILSNTAAYDRAFEILGRRCADYFSFATPSPT